MKFQLQAFKKAKERKPKPNSPYTQDSLLCRQMLIDTYSKVAFAKLYGCKNALNAADMLNDHVVPFFDTNV